MTLCLSWGGPKTSAQFEPLSHWASPDSSDDKALCWFKEPVTAVATLVWLCVVLYLRFAAYRLRLPLMLRGNFEEQIKMHWEGLLFLYHLNGLRCLRLFSFITLFYTTCLASFETLLQSYFSAKWNVQQSPTATISLQLPAKIAHLKWYF